MLQCSCAYAGLESFGAASDSEFEAINNAIVRAGTRGGAWYALASDWQDRVVDSRDWKIAIPPLWSGLMEEFWTKYSQLYRAEPNKAGLSNPYDIAPTGIPGALRDLWAPTAAAVTATSDVVTAALQQVKDAATAKVNAALQAAGRSLAKGAAEESQKQTSNYGVALASLGAVGLLGYYLWSRGSAPKLF